LCYAGHKIMNKWEIEDYRITNWDNRRWPEYSQVFSLFVLSDEFSNAYKARVEWIYLNIENCEKHSRWDYFLGNDSYNEITTITVKCRREADLIRYILRWS
jgi:hypothetical protein